jgi:hypothetical protein
MMPAIHYAKQRQKVSNKFTRARQGMVIVVPEGDLSDPTRKSEFYDPTFEYLQRIGFKIL